MYPIYDLEGIEKIEKEINEQHLIVFLLVKPSDENAELYINQFNYWHKMSGMYCSIYLPGYSFNFEGKYNDIKKVSGIENKDFEYSDECFIKVIDQLKKRISSWKYSNEPELIVLQSNNNNNSKSKLDFTNYNYVDINYGIKHEYIDSFPRFMGNLIEASKSEVTVSKAIFKAKLRKLSVRKILETAIEDSKKVPTPVKKIVKDALFFKSCKSK